MKDSHKVGGERKKGQHYGVIVDTKWKWMNENK